MKAEGEVAAGFWHRSQVLNFCYLFNSILRLSGLPQGHFLCKEGAMMLSPPRLLIAVFAMDFQTWLAFFAASCLIAVSPGSGAVLSMSHGLSYGVRKASATILGLQLGL